MNILVSGTSNGLGKFLCKKFKAESFNRSINFKPSKSYDIIIHCAYNMSTEVKNVDIANYLNDTVNLTNELLKIKHNLFVFISTVDVYPSEDQTFDEETKINTFNPKNLYALTKIICEENIKQRTKKNLILRSGILLGKHSRINSIKKIINNFKTISLSNKSNFYCIHYKDIESIIRLSQKKKITGTFNCILKPGFTLNELALKFSKKIEFGKYFYKTPKICNRKLIKNFNFLKFSSLECIENNIKDLKEEKII